MHGRDRELQLKRMQAASNRRNRGAAAEAEGKQQQGRQWHKRSGTAHYRSALRKAVPGGRSEQRVGRGAKRRSVRAKRGKIFSHVFL